MLIYSTFVGLSISVQNLLSFPIRNTNLPLNSLININNFHGKYSKINYDTANGATATNGATNGATNRASRGASNGWTIC